MGYRLSIDTGGTFTDVVTMGQTGGQIIGKALTAPERALGGVREALEVAAAEIDTSLGALLAEADMLACGATRATNAIVSRTVAEQVEQTAWDILNPASEGMIRATHEITTGEGLNPRESTVVADGGTAGMDTMTIARGLGCERVTLPKVAPALSASGMQHADIVKEATARLPTSLTCFRHDEVNMIDDIAQMCRGRIRAPNQWHGDFLAITGQCRPGATE